MAFEIVERLQAIEAPEERLAGGGAKRRNYFGVGGTALRAGDDFFLTQQGVFIDTRGFGRGDAEVAQFLPPGFAQPVGRPGGTEDGGHPHPFETAFL